MVLSSSLGARRRIDSLLINVSTLLQEPVGAVREYELADGEFRYDGADRPIAGAVRLLRTDQTVLVSGSLRTSTEDMCGACLVAIALELRIEFDEEFRPGGGAQLQDPFADPDGFAVVDGQIDLSEAVRQYAEMARPMSPRCGPECPGAAPAARGGQDPEQPIDARWAALTKLRDTPPPQSKTADPTSPPP